MEQMDTQRCMGLDKCNGLIVFTHPVLVKEREFHTKHNNELLIGNYNDKIYFSTFANGTDMCLATAIISLAVKFSVILINSKTAKPVFKTLLSFDKYSLFVSFRPFLRILVVSFTFHPSGKLLSTVHSGEVH